MADIIKETWGKNGIEAIVSKNGELWINEKHVEQSMGHSNLPVVTSRYDPMYKKCRFQLVNEPKYRPCRSLIHNDLAKQLVKTLKVPNINALRRGLVYSIVDILNSKQIPITEKTKEIFEVQDIQPEYKVPDLDYSIDIHFHVEVSCRG